MYVRTVDDPIRPHRHSSKRKAREQGPFEEFPLSLGTGRRDFDAGTRG